MATETRFKYDYLGRRVEKAVTQGGVVQKTRYVYAGWHVIAELNVTLNGANAEVVSLYRTFHWGLDLVGSLTQSGGVGALLGIAHAGGDTYLPTFDANGNVASVVRKSDGQVVAAYEYGPFGEALRTEGSYALTNPFRFSTKWHDAETRLVYYGHRYYSPDWGRFINRDPIAEQGGLNLYGFVGNDGVDRWDYLGQSWFSKALKKLTKFGYKVARALTPIRAVRNMLHRLERWEEKHQRELKIAAAILASIVTYGAASQWALGVIGNYANSVALAAGVGETAAASFAAAVTSSTAAGVVAGAVGGAAAGAVSGFITTGSVKGVLQGAAAGFITGGVAAGFPTASKEAWGSTKIFAKSIASGVASEIQGGSFKKGFGFAFAVESLAWVSFQARQAMIEQSRILDPLDHKAYNAGGPSNSFWGDFFKLGGARHYTGKNWQDELDNLQASALGRMQGGPGWIKVFGLRFDYTPGSFSDNLVEAYAGVHDALNSWYSYDAFGNNVTRTGLGRIFGDYILNYANVPIATPFAAAGAYSTFVGTDLTSIGKR